MLDTNTMERIRQMAAKSEVLSLYLQVLYETAARPSEALRLVWWDVNYEYLSIVLKSGLKSRGEFVPRRLPISMDLANKLRHHHGQHPDTHFVFQNRGRETPFTPHKITTLYRCACRKAGTDDFKLYNWRRLRASIWLAEGRPLSEIQAKLGHPQVTMTEQFFHNLRRCQTKI